jgi:hypothetical protein
LDIALTTLLLKTAAGLLTALLPVTIKTNSGEQIDGNLLGIADTQLRIDVAGQERMLAFDDVSSLTPQSIAPQTGPTYLVTMINGTRIAAQDVSLSANEMLVTPRHQPTLRVPVQQVKSIRFRAANATTDAAWLGIVAGESRGDTLVIRRGDDRLDPQTGIIEGIADAKVAFDLEGDKVDAPIDRLEGLVFGGTREASGQAAIRITDVYGSEWAAVAIDNIEIATTDTTQSLTVKLSESLSHSIPLDQVETIRWSGGVLLLSGDQPVTTAIAPYFETKLDPKLIQQLFAPQADGADLLAVGGSTIEYRLESGYQTFAGTVHRMKSVRSGSGLNVQIEFDGAVVWQQELIDAEPRGFELPIGDARRVTIKIDNGNDGDLGDTVRIVRPRITK